MKPPCKYKRYDILQITDVWREHLSLFTEWHLQLPVQPHISAAFTVTAVQWLIVFNRGVNMATFNEKNLLFDLCYLKIWYTSFISMNEFQTLSVNFQSFITHWSCSVGTYKYIYWQFLDSPQDRKSLYKATDYARQIMTCPPPLRIFRPAFGPELLTLNSFAKQFIIEFYGIDSRSSFFICCALTTLPKIDYVCRSTLLLIGIFDNIRISSEK